MKSYWSMNVEEQAEWLIEFTKIHSSFNSVDIEAREAAILAHQIPAIFLPPEADDLLVGRFHYPPLVFTPQPAGDRGGFAYVADPKRLKNIAESLSSEQLAEQVLDLLPYWNKNDSGQQTRKAYPVEISRLLPSDNWTGEPGIGFPLLRMSGSHLDYAKLMELGIPGLAAEVDKMMLKHPDSRKLGLAMQKSLDSLRQLILYYERGIRDLLGRSNSHSRSLELRALADALANISLSAPVCLLEGIQLSYLFCLCSGSNNLGRMDDYLGPLYVQDLNSGKISRTQAIEYFVHLWKLLNFREIIYDGRVIIGGKGRLNSKEADELALVLIESVGICANVLPQLTLRMYEGMDPRLKELSLDNIARGNPYPMLYNDEVNVPSAMNAFEVDEKTAEDIVPFGCGEYVLYRRSFGTPSGVINLLKALEVSLHKGNDPVGPRPLGVPKANIIEIKSFDDLWKSYCINLEAYIHALAVQEKIEYETAGAHAPFLFFSMLFNSCMERGKAIFNGGIEHLGGTLETYGNTNTADALLAIKNVVFKEKRISLDELVQALDSNFEESPDIRKMLLDQPKYGNDIEEADDMLKQVHDHVCLATKAEARKVGLDSYLVVNINNSANTIFGKYTAASADGRLAYTTMANGNTPHMGMDKQGATALLNSIVKPRTDIHAGSSQNFKLSREMLTRFRQQSTALIDTYFKIGGAQLMITAVNKGDLERALAHPEEYPNLLVRVGGFSARFVELERDIQLEILNRTLY